MTKSKCVISHPAFSFTNIQTHADHTSLVWQNFLYESELFNVLKSLQFFAVPTKPQERAEQRSSRHHGRGTHLSSCPAAMVQSTGSGTQSCYPGPATELCLFLNNSRGLWEYTTAGCFIMWLHYCSV